MKNTINYLILGCLIFSTQAFAHENIGILKTVTGEVVILRGGSVLKAAPGSQLMANDTLITKKDGYAGVIFTDGTSLTIGPMAEYNIRDYLFNPAEKAYSFSMYLKKGAAVYNSGKIGKLSPESVNIETPRASMGIRGTRLIITEK